MKILKNVIISVIVLTNMLIVGCVFQPVNNNSQQGDRVTVGTVQKEIKVGMSSASVVSALGSPNIVTSDDNGGEVWIYDKISSNVSYSSTGSYISLLLIGGSESSSSSSSSQKTLTIIVKFDANKKVSSFKYHTSRF